MLGEPNPFYGSGGIKRPIAHAGIATPGLTNQKAKALMWWNDSQTKGIPGQKSKASLTWRTTPTGEDIIFVGVRKGVVVTPPRISCPKFVFPFHPRIGIHAYFEVKLFSFENLNCSLLFGILLLSSN